MAFSCNASEMSSLFHFTYLIEGVFGCARLLVLMAIVFHRIHSSGLWPLRYEAFGLFRGCCWTIFVLVICLQDADNASIDVLCLRYFWRLMDFNDGR